MGKTISNSSSIFFEKAEKQRSNDKTAPKINTYNNEKDNKKKRTHVGQHSNPVAHCYKKYCGKVFSRSQNVGTANTIINTVL